MIKGKKASQEKRAGNWLNCPICGWDPIHHREGMLNKRVMSLIDLDWINPRADCYICEKCLHILWFYGEGEKL